MAKSTEKMALPLNMQMVLNGQRHREDGPAIECANGSKFWYVNGKLHREDGPAIIWSDGSKFWYLNGERLSKAKFNQRTQEVVLTMDEIAKKFNIPAELLKIKKRMSRMKTKNFNSSSN